MTDHGLGAHPLAIARGRAYDLLADLFAHGPLRLQHLRAVEPLAPHLPDAPDDESLAEHHRVMVLEVPANAGVFLHASGLLGGDTAHAARRAMANGGYQPDTRSTEADHISAMLGYLAWMSAAEAHAIQDHQTAAAAALAERSRAFIDTHLLSWLAPFVVALESADGGLYAAAARLLGGMLADHLARPPTPRPLPVEARNLLAEPRVGVRQIADYLAVPVQAGALLTPTWIRQVARDTGGATGFGRRSQRLEGLLQTAARRDEMTGTLALLKRELGALAARLGELPGGAPWQARCEAAAALIGQMQTALAASQG